MRGGGEEGGGCSVSAAAVIHSAENTDEFSGVCKRLLTGLAIKMVMRFIVEKFPLIQGYC